MRATAVLAFLVACLLKTTPTINAFSTVVIHPPLPTWSLPALKSAARRSDARGVSALFAWAVDSNEEFVNGDGIHQWINPSAIRFEDSKKVTQRLMAMAGIVEESSSSENHNAEASTTSSTITNEEDDEEEEDAADDYDGAFPYALMMQVSAPYIASHAKKVAVFHIPGALLLQGQVVSKVKKAATDKLLSDIHMSWMLGMKIVLVVGSSYDWDVCDVNSNGNDSGDGGAGSLRQCYPKSSSSSSIRYSLTNSASSSVTTSLLEEEAGFLRTEVERKLNRFLQKTCLGGARRQMDGNVVSGNFYTATRLRIRPSGQQQQQTGNGNNNNNNNNNNGDDEEDEDDFSHYTGYASEIHIDKIQRILQQNNDIVVLTTVGQTRRGNVVNVNGHQLTAAVAAALQAYKVIYMASQGCVLQQQISSKKQDGAGHDNTHTGSSSTSTKRLFELPLSIAQSITDYHRVHVRQGKFATIQDDIHSHDSAAADATATGGLGPRAVELLLNMAWACWAVDHGVRRAHIVNPTDGALLEELFTSRNGANLCLYHDDELRRNDNDENDDDDEDAEELLLANNNDHYDDHDDDYYDNDFGMSSSRRDNNINTPPFSSMPTSSSSMPPPHSTRSAADFMEELRQKRRRASDSFQ
jgi:acetylglutamate kinase